MFTLKFYRNEYDYDVIEASHYNIRKIQTVNDEWEVTLYKDFTTQSGVVYRVADNLEVCHFKYAYIENSSGKTIEALRPKK